MPTVLLLFITTHLLTDKVSEGDALSLLLTHVLVIVSTILARTILDGARAQTDTTLVDINVCYLSLDLASNWEGLRNVLTLIKSELRVVD